MFKELKKRLEKSNIVIRVTNDVETARVGFTNRKFRVDISDQPPFDTDDMKFLALVHELGHIVRGDLKMTSLKLKEMEEEDKAAAAFRYNIAADAHINNKSFVSKVVGITPVEYGTLRLQFPELPKEIPSTQIIYEVLSKQDKDNLPKAFDEFGDIEGVISDEDQTRAAMGVRIAAESLGIDNLKTVVKRNTKVFKPNPIPSIDNLLKKVNGFGGTYKFSRTWRRPNTRNKHIRGGGYQPRPRGTIIIDSSGSMSSHVGTMLGICSSLNRTHDLMFIVHDTSVSYKGKQIPTSLPSGGTQFLDAYLAAASDRPDIVVHLTDGETSDSKEALSKLSCPVIWARPDNKFVAEVM